MGGSNTVTGGPFMVQGEGIITTMDQRVTVLETEFRTELKHPATKADLQSLEYRLTIRSSSVLLRVFERNLPAGSTLPDWCSIMTLDEYQNRAFERPRLVLENLLHRDKYSGERRPSIGGWTISGNSVIVAVEPIVSRRMREDIPDWILDDTASVSDQIVMNRDLLQEFLGHSVGRRRRFLGLF